MKYGSLFSGAGGFELGLNKLGWQCEWMCEIDTYPRGVLEYHWPKIPLYKDVKLVKGHEVEPVDVIVGGFPCQDLSNAGLKAGLTGDKSSLFYEYVRIVKEMRDATNGQYPRAIIWENVPGVLNKSKDWISDIYTAWSEIGALVQEHRLIDAKYFGVPQRRKRVIGAVIFDTRNECGREILLEPEAGFGDIRKIGEAGKSATGKTKKGSPEKYTELVPIDTTQLSHPANAANPKYDEEFPTLSASMHHPKVAYSITPITGQGSLLSGKETNIANTLTSTDAPDRGLKIVEDGYLRKLTEVEMERLMGWPDEHTKYKPSGVNSVSRRRAMCGNGVAAPVAEWAGRRLELYLDHPILGNDTEEN